MSALATSRFMKVHEQNLTGASATGRASETQHSGRTGSGAAAKAGGDRVELSHAAGSIARTLGSDAAGRASRVRELAAQYRSGTYRPDAAATGRAMVSDAIAPALG
jgi:anti-sigma28 factor (negative regulator of flagellin synthesis)